MTPSRVKKVLTISFLISCAPSTRFRPTHPQRYTPTTNGPPQNHAMTPPYETDAQGDGAGLCDSQTYNSLKIRFSATLGEEPEVEGSWYSGYAFVSHQKLPDNCVPGS